MSQVHKFFYFMNINLFKSIWNEKKKSHRSIDRKAQGLIDVANSHSKRLIKFLKKSCSILHIFNDILNNNQWKYLLGIISKGICTASFRNSLMHNFCYLKILLDIISKFERLPKSLTNWTVFNYFSTNWTTILINFAFTFAFLLPFELCSMKDSKDSKDSYVMVIDRSGGIFIRRVWRKMNLY